MQLFEFENLGLQEMNAQQMEETNGGFLYWVWREMLNSALDSISSSTTNYYYEALGGS